MYIDKTKMFSDAQTIASGVSTNVIDRGDTGEAYEALFLYVSVSVPLLDTQGLKVAVETSADGVTFTEIANFTAEKKKAAVIKQRFPMGAKRYVRLNYVATGTPTGKVTAALTTDV